MYKFIRGIHLYSGLTLLVFIVMYFVSGYAMIHRQWFGSARTLSGFHRLHGFGGGWAYDLWAVILDLVSVSMLVFALTGIYLWYRLTKRRLLGWVLLTLSFAYTGGTIAYLLWGG